MKIFPIVRETLVLPYSANEVELTLWQNVYPVFNEDEMPDRPESEFLFNGWLKNKEFQISRRERQAEYFSPIMTGFIESTSIGSIVFIKYNLFRATNTLLILWSALTLFLFFYFLIVEEAYINATIALGLCIVNYIVVVTNFNIQVKKSRQKLKSMFNKGSQDI